MQPFYHWIHITISLKCSIPWHLISWNGKKVIYHVFLSNVTKKKKKDECQQYMRFSLKEGNRFAPLQSKLSILCTVMYVQTDTRAPFLPHTFEGMLQKCIAVKPGKRKTAPFIWVNKSIMWFIENIYNSEKQSRTFGKHLIHSENQNLKVKLSHEKNRKCH